MQFFRGPPNVQKHQNSSYFMAVHVYMRTTLNFLKHFYANVTETNLSKFDEGLFSDIYLCRLRLEQGREIRILCFEAGGSRGTLQ